MASSVECGKVADDDGKVRRVVVGTGRKEISLVEEALARIFIMALYLDDSSHSRAAKFLALFVQQDKNLIMESDLHSNCSIAYPYLVLNGGKNFTASGLCHVARQIVKHAVNNTTDDSHKKQRELLLGYKQNCLKACAEVSSWTKFCERDFPIAVENLIHQIKSKSFPINIPDVFIKLEKEFDIPKKTPNATKYFTGKSRKALILRDLINLNPNVLNRSVKDILTVIGTRKFCSCPCAGDQGLHDGRPNNEWMSNVKSKHDIKWPYLCALHITIADILIFAFMLELLSWMIPCHMNIEQFFSHIPNIFKWFLRCSSHNGIIDAACHVWDFQKQNKCFQISIDEQLFTTLPENNVKHLSFEDKPTNPKQMHSQIEKNLPRILQTIKDNNINPEFAKLEGLSSICWSEMPAGVNPTEGELNASRSLRKCQQIENMAAHILSIAKSGDRIVDFCAGGGHLGIVIAYLRKDCHITLLENKEESIDRALARIKKLQLTNVTVHLTNLNYFHGEFDVGVTLHACGSATDLVLAKCINKRASFVVSPCCYGSIRPTDSVKYSKSSKFSCLQTSEYFLLAHSADQTSSDYTSEYSKIGKKSMLLVDHDRALHADESGCYTTSIYSMIPETCSPKNNLIVGLSNK